MGGGIWNQPVSIYIFINLSLPGQESRKKYSLSQNKYKKRQKTMRNISP